MNSPYFSVIVPVYNAAAHLSATIRSVLNQSDRDFELIMVDDGSTDNSLTIMMGFAEKDQRIKLVSQSNGGVSKARNLGMELARGELMVFLDADDLWRANKLEAHRDFHEANPAIDASYAKIGFMDQNGTDGHNAKTYSTIHWGSLTVDQVIAENPACTMSNLVVSRTTVESVGGFEAGMSYAEDQEWMARIVSQGFEIAGIDQYLVDYRLSPDGLSVDLPAMYAGWRLLADRYSSAETISASEAIYCRYLSRRALRAGAPAKVALAYAMQGLNSDVQAFLNDPKRGWMTLISAFSAHFLPRSARIQLFA